MLNTTFLRFDFYSFRTLYENDGRIKTIIYIRLFMLEKELIKSTFDLLLKEKIF